MAPSSVQGPRGEHSPANAQRLRSATFILYAFALTCVIAPQAGAQQPTAQLQLLVTDGATGAPISGAEVVVNGSSSRMLSSPSGMVELATTPGDSVFLELRKLGYVTRSLTAFPTTGQPLLINIPLELDPISLDPVRVEVEGAHRSRELREFYARSRGGAGQFLTREDIENRQARNITDLFRMLPGIPMSYTALGEKLSVEAKASMIPDRGGAECSMQYFLDGTPLNPQNGILQLEVDLAEVEGIEIYRRGTGVPARFQRQHGSCGVILIWKRVGLGG